MSTNIFSLLPYDVKLCVITPFLSHHDALVFNAVLRRDERVYKKLPTDYAIKHQIKLSYETYHALARPLLFSLGKIAEQTGWQDIHVPKAVRLLKKYFAWFKDPKNYIVLMYVRDRREGFLAKITDWTEDDMELYTYLLPSVREELRKEAQEVVALVSEVPFMRHVSQVGHKSAFAA